MDKAKKLAEQAQTKLDDAQKQFNQPGAPASAPSGGPVEYDQHGRPVAPQPPVADPAPPHGDPLGAQAAPATPVPPPAPAAPSARDGGADPLGATPGMGAAPPPAPADEPGVVAEGGAETAPGPPPEGTAAARPSSQGVPEDRNRPSYEPPALSSGDPLAG